MVYSRLCRRLTEGGNLPLARSFETEGIECEQRSNPKLGVGYLAGHAGGVGPGLEDLRCGRRGTSREPDISGSVFGAD